MADRENSIQLLLTSHDIDHTQASALHCPEGQVIVEMLPETDRIGIILLPEVVAGKFRPDVGIVIGRGPDVALDVGATVCVRGYDGKWIECFDAGYTTKNQIRVYGAAAKFQGEIQESPWSDSIPLQVVQEGDDFDLYATGPNVIIQRDPTVESESGFILPASATYRTGKATIVSIGPTARLVTDDGQMQVGDRVCYDSMGELDFAFGADPNLAIVPDTAIWVKVVA